MASRSALYGHYARQHFLKEMKQEFGCATECPICEHKSNWVNLVQHLGQVHDKVEKYLPEEAKIPRELQRRRGRGFSEDLLQGKALREVKDNEVGLKEQSNGDKDQKVKTARELQQLKDLKCRPNSVRPPEVAINVFRVTDSKEVSTIRMFQGQQFDFRCIYCKVLPREGMLSRTELYRHYAFKHFGEKLKSEYGEITICPICGMEKKIWGDLLKHLGQVHDKVENYLPDEAKIPRVFQRFARMKTSGVMSSRVTKKNGVFPAIPESFCSGMELQRRDKEEEFIGKQKLSSDIVDGFIIEELMVVEEAEEFGYHHHPDENLKCAICYMMFSRGCLNQAVKHLEELHGVRGLGLQLNLALSRVISAGYLLRPSHVTSIK